MASGATSINDLPDEILVKICSYFGLEDLCLIIAKVCEKWKDLAKDMIVWKKLPYYCDRSSDISHIKKVRFTALFGLGLTTLRIFPYLVF
jgi:hypothetical protein